MRRGRVLKSGETPDGKLVEVVEKLDEQGNLIGYAVFIDGEEISDFGPGGLDEAFVEADRHINLPKPGAGPEEPGVGGRKP